MRARPFERAVARLAGPDGAAAAATVRRLDRLTKPRGSLGRLELLAVELAAIAASCPPPVPSPAHVVVFAGDHGVHAQGVSPWPQSVTAQMVANVAAGGAAISVLARQAGVTVEVVDVGVATTVPGRADAWVDRRIRAGTDDLSRVPAMSVDDARAALDAGAERAEAAVAAGARCLLTGDMGIANTTPSAALVAAFTGLPAADVTGRGTGVDDATLARKTAIVEAAAARVRGGDPIDVLAGVGGLEHAALAGFVVAGAAARTPVVLDGVVALSSALVAAAFAPLAVPYWFAGHRPVEPGGRAALDSLRLVPILDLALRLGEGTGAVLALPVLQAAARVVAEMATFDDAGVSER